MKSSIAPVLAILEPKTERVNPGAQRDGEMLLQARSGRICAPHGPAWSRRAIGQSTRRRRALWASVATLMTDPAWAAYVKQYAGRGVGFLVWRGDRRAGELDVGHTGKHSSRGESAGHPWRPLADATGSDSGSYRCHDPRGGGIWVRPRSHYRRKGSQPASAESEPSPRPCFVRVPSGYLVPDRGCLTASDAIAWRTSSRSNSRGWSKSSA